jgi:hypothetical protein
MLIRRKARRLRIGIGEVRIGEGKGRIVRIVAHSLKHVLGVFVTEPGKEVCIRLLILKSWRLCKIEHFSPIISRFIILNDSYILMPVRFISFFILFNFFLNKIIICGFLF